MKLKKCVTVVATGSILAASIGGNVTVFAAMDETSQEVLCEQVFDEKMENEDAQIQIEELMSEEQGEQDEETLVSEEYEAALLKEIEAEYDLEKKVLIVEWEGENIAYADVYQDDVLLAQQVSGDRLVKEISLEALSTHTYKVIPYNANKEAAEPKTVQYKIDDYNAKIQDLNVDYKASSKQIMVEWTAVNTFGVSIYVNEQEVANGYTGNQFTINYQPQSGAVYNIVVIPYNQKGTEGEEKTEMLQLDQLETPYINKIKQKSVPTTDENGKYTGFQKPAAEVFWDGEENAVYEIYRGEKDKKSAYHYVGKVKSTKDGQCSYLDTSIAIGEYYYKIRKVVVEDEYISQEIATSLSDSDSITVSVPRAKMQAKLMEGNKIQMTLEASKDFVSGYEIYKKAGSGKYKKTATVTENNWTDENITFGTNYKYKVRAYYYDEKTRKKYYGDYSKIFCVQSNLGSVKLKTDALTAKKVKISWKRVANADGYEVYFKSNVQGDGFRLLDTTKKLSYVKEFKKSGSYTFLVRAYKKVRMIKCFIPVQKLFIRRDLRHLPDSKTVKRYIHLTKQKIY